MSNITRRRLNLTLTLGAACSAVSPLSAIALGGLGNLDLEEVTISDLRRRYSERRLTVRQVTDWHLARIQALNPALRAVVRIMPERARIQAAALDAMGRPDNRPLWGVPILVKDNTAVGGEQLTNGWSGYDLSGHAFVARKSAVVVRRLEAAGAIILGHSNMPDFAKSDTTTSTILGRTGNAYDPNRSPGGSSGGAAVAVADSLAVAAQGTDTGNSIRNPAANAALVGVLPTRGLVSIDGIHPYDWLLDNTGPLTRTVTDAALLLEAMAKPVSRRSWPSYSSSLKRNSLAGRRLGVPRFILEGSPHARPMPRYWNRGASPETRKHFLGILDELRSCGAVIVLDDHLMDETFDALALKILTKPYRQQGVDAFLADYAPAGLTSVAGYGDTIGRPFPIEGLTDGVAQLALENDPRGAEDYSRPRKALMAAFEATLTRFKLDGLVYPALQVRPNDERTPLPNDYPADGPYSATNWVNRLGIPAVVTPAGFDADGLPYAVEMAGRAGRDADVLGWAFAYEQATHHRKPPKR